MRKNAHLYKKKRFCSASLFVTVRKAPATLAVLKHPHTVLSILSLKRIFQVDKLRDSSMQLFLVSLACGSVSSDSEVADEVKQHTHAVR